MAVLVGLAVFAQAAMAKDLKALADIVAPAYTAMNFAVVCTQDDPQFISRTQGARGSALNYAEHVKNEVISSLSYDESVIVLKAAADEARSVARQEVRKHARDYPKGHLGELTSWCQSDATQFVRTFIEKHDAGHAVLMQEIERASR